MIDILFYILIFVAGAFIGSFLNVVVDRLQNGESIFFGRSHCDHCKHPLVSKDLIPLLSFLFLKGRCRYCKKKISLYYPLSEIITGFSFVGIAYFLKIFEFNSITNWVLFAYLVIVASFYIVIFLLDAKYRIIPNKIVFAAIIFVMLFTLVNFGIGATTFYYQLKNDEFGKFLLESGFWQDRVLFYAKNLGYTFVSAFAIALFFWSLIFITKGRGMGGGDVRLGFLIGIFNSFPLNIVAIFLGFLIGALYSVVLLLFRKRGMKDTIPFGPFLILGSVIAFVYGRQLLDWYLGLF